MAINSDLIVILVTGFLILIYAAVMFWAHQNKKLIFAPYTRPPLKDAVPLTVNGILGTGDDGKPIKPTNCPAST